MKPFSESVSNINPGGTKLILFLNGPCLQTSEYSLSSYILNSDYFKVIFGSHFTLQGIHSSQVCEQ